MKIIQFPAALGQEIGNEIFKDCAFVTEQRATENIGLCTLFKHTDEQSDVRHIYFECVFLGIAVKGQFCDAEIITPLNDACIFYPLQATGEHTVCGFLFDLGILKFFVLLAELFGYGVETFTDFGFVCLGGIFYHIIAIAVYNVPLHLQYIVH